MRDRLMVHGRDFLRTSIERHEARSNQREESRDLGSLLVRSASAAERGPQCKMAKCMRARLQ